jgi:glycine/D-amino acid oxidase-like deaminating enzyme
VLGAFRTDDAGRLIVGSAGALRGIGAAIHRAWALRHMRALFPQLGEIALEHEWYGRIGMTNDHLPRLHAPAENMIALAGFNGRGIAPGTVFGREFARYIAGEMTLDEMFLPVTPARNARFRAVREGYYEFGSQIAHLPPAW